MEIGIKLPLHASIVNPDKTSTDVVVRDEDASQWLDIVADGRHIYFTMLDSDRAEEYSGHIPIETVKGLIASLQVMLDYHQSAKE